MSSLLGSIFGNEAAAHVAVAADADLFGGAILPPIVVNPRPTAATTTTKKKTNTISSFVNNDSEDDDDDNDDELTHEETSSSEDIGTAAAAATATTTTVKKTKREIVREETSNKLQRTIFVGNLPPDITRGALASLFASTFDCGKVESARLRSIPVTGVKLPPQYAGNDKLMRKVCINTGRVGYIATDAPSIGGGGGIIIIAKTCAQGYVVFEKMESVQLALNKNNTIHENRTIRVDRVVVPEYDDANSTTSVDGGSSTTTTTIKHDIAKNSVFVGNLPYGADEETLRRHFISVLLGDGSDIGGDGGSNEEEDGSSTSIITGVRIIRDSETRQCKGFGYIALRDGTYIADALRAHGTVYMKRELRVMICGRGSKGMKKSGSGAKPLAGGGGGLRPRTFEGHRTTTRNHSSTSTSNNNNNNKRKLDNGGGVGGSVTKKRRARSEKKTSDGGGKASKGERLSKRAATEARVKKRVKKLQQRVVKGMGKKKK